MLGQGGVPLARSLIKLCVRPPSVLPTPFVLSTAFGWRGRRWISQSHPGIRSLSNRKGRGRRSGGREREPRRAGEGRLVWNRNYCVLIDYRLWAAKSEGRQWVDHCIDLYVDHCIDHHPEPRSGLCPELLADFRIPKPTGCSQENPRGFFLCSPSSRFSGRGGGWGASPGRGGRV